MKASLTFFFLILPLKISWAQEVTEQISVPQTEKEYKKILVTDDADDFVVNPAAPHRISKEKIELYKYTDINRALRQTTGAYVREEDGQGLRPNIGLRGTNPDRSKKVVILQDGILAGPAPYSAPAAYYTPSMNHTQSLEVFKGFTAVPYGPNSIGGSVNYISFEIPSELTPKLEVSTGAFNTQSFKTSIGDNSGKIGYLVQASRLTSDGFKKLDGGGNTGFEKNEIAIKLKTDLNNKQNIETRLGYSDEISNETYLGLAARDIISSPYRRYSASALDKMDWQHTKVELQHTYKVSEESQIKTTLYRHDFQRDWRRLDGFRSSNANNDVSLFDILNNPADNAIKYQIISGQADSSSAGLGGIGDLILLDNQRTFYSQGVQSQFNSQFNWGSTSHDIELGLRYHQDQIRRTHTQNIYQMVSSQLTASGIAASPRDLNSNKASALTMNFLENMKWRQWVFTALGRVEQVNFSYINRMPQQEVQRDDTVFAPGVGVLYNFNNHLSLKGSVNQGVSIAGLDDLGTEAKEESVNYELGLKYVSPNMQSQIELVTFYNDYSNITGTCSSSTGCSNQQLDLQFNGGKAAILGFEGRASQNFRIGAVNIPVQFNMTALKAEFKNSFSSRTPEWGNGTVNSGDPLPYIPQIQYTLSAGTEYGKFKHEFAFIYQGEAYDQSVAQNRLKIPAYGIIDWTARYDWSKKMQLFARADNILGKDYIVSYRPFGARPGKPQSFMVGLSYTF